MKEEWPFLEKFPGKVFIIGSENAEMERAFTEEGAEQLSQNSGPTLSEGAVEGAGSRIN